MLLDKVLLRTPSSMPACEAAFTFYPLYNEEGVFPFVVGASQCIVYIAILAFQFYLRWQVKHGDDAAARKLVSPSYVVLLVAYGISAMIAGILIGYYTPPPYPAPVDLRPALWLGFGSAITHFVFEGIAVFLCMEGCGGVSLRKAAQIASAFGLFFFAVSVCSKMVVS